jgi:hypothetical protein
MSEVEVSRTANKQERNSRDIASRFRDMEKKLEVSLPLGTGLASCLPLSLHRKTFSANPK